MRYFKSSIIVSIASLVVFIPNARAFTEHTASIGQLAVQHDTAVKHGELAGATFGYASQRFTAPIAAAVVEAPVSAPVSNNEAKAFIYQHESGNKTTSINSIGCRGLGQACPGSKLPCGNDYACQDAYFTNYMQQRYGTWENAKSFWQAQCDSSKGCWW